MSKPLKPNRLLNSGKLLIGLISLLLFNQAWSNSETPQRVISLAPHVTEMLFSAGAGDKIVGVVAYSDHPAAALQIENIGSYNAINIEKVIQLNPDIIIAWKTGNRPKDVEKLQQLGFKVVYSQPYLLDDIVKEIREFGRLLGTEAQAEPMAQRLQQTLQRLRQQYQHKKPVTAFYQIWNSPMMTINGEQIISQAMNICGANNAFHDLPLLAGEVSIESVIKKNPDTILLGGQQAMQQAWLKEWMKWQTLTAVKQQQVYLLQADTYQRPTERLINGLQALCETIDQARAAKP